MLYCFLNVMLSLTLLELGILLVNDVQASFPPDDLAFGTALFYRCSDFHVVIFLLTLLTSNF